MPLDPAGPFTDEWCLFEALLRLSFGEAAPRSFAAMKHFLTLEEGQAFRHAGKHRVSRAGKRVVLHRFDRTGAGCFSWEYWLSESQRMVLAVTGPRVYALDPSLLQGNGKGGREVGWRDFIVAELSRGDSFAPMVGTMDFKYIVYQGDPVETLFHPPGDPGETKNQARDPPSYSDVPGEHRRLLERWERGFVPAPDLQARYRWIREV